MMANIIVKKTIKFVIEVESQMILLLDHLSL